MNGIHGFGHSHAFGMGRMEAKATWKAQVMAGEQPSRGERIVARLDQDGDAMLGVDELKDTRFGARLSVDRFARMDASGDGMLGAGEIDAAHGTWRGRPDVESAVTMQLDGDATAQVMAGLDADGSGALNSEEIAGTRLAGMIGASFYEIDADRSGDARRRRTQRLHRRRADRDQRPAARCDGRGR